MKLLLLVCMSLVSVSVGASELFNFGGFNDHSAIALQGSATVATTRVRLTPAIAGASGAMWYPTKRFLREGFDTTFQFQLGPDAEGLAFVIEGSALPALSVGGAGLGYVGSPGTELEFAL